MRVYYTDQFVLPLPAGHRFPMAKYQRLRETLLAQRVLDPSRLMVPEPASRDQLVRVHAPSYVDRVFAGELTREETRRIGFPWSAFLVERSCRSVGATIEACRAALTDGLSANLAGGTHHAGVGHGEGYCVFNDTAVAVRAVQAERAERRVIVIDCDVHQGNGTAEIFAADDSVCTFDIYGASNFPFTKTPCDCDVPLPDDTGDEEYLAALQARLPAALDAGPWDLAIYVSGADPYAGDTLGRLALTKQGLLARDEFVLYSLRDRGIPVAITMAGGYGHDVDDTVEIHANTIRAAMALYQPEFV